MKNFSEIKKLFKTFFEKPRKQSKINITDVDEDSVVSRIDLIGITNTGQGVLILKTDEGKQFPISAFSGDVARNISDFKEGKGNEMPTAYNMLEQICEELEVTLVKVRIFKSGQALRANLYFTGKKEMVLRNHRASDAIAMAAFYNIPVLIKKELLEHSPEISTK